MMQQQLQGKVPVSSSSPSRHLLLTILALLLSLSRLPFSTSFSPHPAKATATSTATVTAAVVTVVTVVARPPLRFTSSPSLTVLATSTSTSTSTSLFSNMSSSSSSSKKEEEGDKTTIDNTSASASTSANSSSQHITNVLFIECGFGNDSHGQSSTKAAVRACRNAIEFNSIPSINRLVPGGYDQLKLGVILAVPPKYQPELDLEAVGNVFPYGEVEFTIQDGGMVAPSGIAIDALGDTNDDMVVVCASVTVGY